MMTELTNAQRLVLSYFDEDPTMSSTVVADSAGITRQAVYACLNKYRPDWKAKAAAAREAAKPPPPPPPDTHPCAVCAKPASLNRRTCGGECAKAWNTLRWHLDPTFRSAQRKRKARWILDNQDKAGSGSVKWAKRVLKEKGAPPPSRWVVRDGGNAEYADQILRRDNEGT
jgi:hypothetical protein